MPKQDRAGQTAQAPTSGLQPCDPPPACLHDSRYRPWAELLRRTFGIDVETCPRCGGRMRLLAVITDLASAARFPSSRRRADRAALARLPLEPRRIGRARLYDDTANPSSPRSMAPLTTQRQVPPIAKPLMADTHGEDVSRGAAVLAMWWSKRPGIWNELLAMPDTRRADILKDPDMYRGQRICLTGTVVQIFRDNPPVRRLRSSSE